MHRLLEWESGLYDEMPLIYEKAGGDDEIGGLLEKLEQAALSEAQEACLDGGIFAKMVGATLSPDEFNELASKDKEAAIKMLAGNGFDKISRNDEEKILYIKLKPAINKSKACSVFEILNRLEKLDGIINTNNQKWELELQIPLGGRNNFVQWEILIMRLYPWISIREISTDETVDGIPQGYVFENEKNNLEKYIRPSSDIKLNLLCGGILIFSGLLMTMAEIRIAAVLMIVGCLIVISGFKKLETTKTTLDLLEKSGILNEICMDFYSAEPKINNLLRFGKRWLFARQARTVVEYKDIERMYISVHRTSGVVDGRKLVLKLHSGKEVVLSNILNKTYAEPIFAEMKKEILARNPNIITVTGESVAE